MNNYYIRKSSISVLIFALLFCSCIFTGCLQLKTEDPVNIPLSTGIGSFDFSTTAEINLSVNYGLTYSILFEVYNKNPFQTIEGVDIKDNTIEPIFRAITNEQGMFNGMMSAPTASKKLFLYTVYMGAPTLVPIDVENQIASFDFTVKPSALQLAATRAGTVIGDIMTIGGWNTVGTPDYLLSRIKLDGELMNNIMYTLPESKFGIGMTGDKHGFIREGDAIGDIRILKNTKVNLIFMHEGASMLNALSYYTYPTGNPPATREEIKRTVAFPNLSYAYSGGELSSGDRVSLKYWNGTEFVDEFPAGTTIGWCLIANGFKSSTVNANYTPLTFYSNPIFNPERSSKQHCVALRDKDKKIIALGFEDQNRETERNGVLVSDNDFNDAVFYIESEVEDGFDKDGIPDMIPDPTPVPNPDDNYITYSGSLAFEDLWPSKGDYDMNDAVIDYTSTHYRNANNQVVSIVDKFTPKWSGAGKKNGFGYQLDVSSSMISKVKIETECDNSFNLFKTDGKGLELNQNKATIVLFEDIKAILNQNTSKSTTFTITIDFTSPVSSSLVIPPYNPFIVSSGDGNARGVEVHLPNKIPTNLADKSLLGTANDASNPQKNIYYISNENYMFALNLPVIFDYPDEFQSLENAYPRFRKWVDSKGTTDQDWYMDARKKQD